MIDIRSRREFGFFLISSYICCWEHRLPIDDPGSWLVQEVRSRLHHRGPSKLNLGLASLSVCACVCMFVCEWGSAHPHVCLNVTRRLSIFRPLGWRTGSGEEWGFTMDVSLLLMTVDWYQTEIYQVLSSFMLLSSLGTCTTNFPTHSVSLTTSRVSACHRSGFQLSVFMHIFEYRMNRRMMEMLFYWTIQEHIIRKMFLHLLEVVFGSCKATILCLCFHFSVKRGQS